MSKLWRYKVVQTIAPPLFLLRGFAYALYKFMWKLISQNKCIFIICFFLNKFKTGKIILMG